MSRRKGHIPIRTCLSCGRKESRKGMIRMALDENGKIFLDEAGTASGRGAYVCRKRECLDGLLQCGRVNRAFRTKGVVPTASEDLKSFRKKITRLALP